MNSFIAKLNNNRTFRAIFCLVVIYCVGIVGMLTPWAAQFVLLTPLNLLVSLGIVLWAQEGKNATFYWVLAACYVAGFAVELIGTQTGFIFGYYEYGATLGLKIAKTPLLIGINWAILIYSVIVLNNTFFSSASSANQGAIGASVMVALDILIEPVAVRYDFWAWSEMGINAWLVAPLQNYLAWWCIAYVLIRLASILLKDYKNNAALVLLLLQFLFFGMLNLSIIR